MDKLNPMLAVSIYEAHAQESKGLPSAVQRAAVHAWYEGHIAAEGDRRAPSSSTNEPFPSPPFPAVGDEALAAIIAQTVALFTAEDLTPAATAYAAGLSFAAGFAEGRRCPGCSFRGHDLQMGFDIRSGRTPIWLYQGHAGSGPVAEEPTQNHADLARRLCAAFVSAAQGLKTIDTTYKQTSGKEISAYWKRLAAQVQRETQDNIRRTLAPNVTDDTEQHH